MYIVEVLENGSFQEYTIAGKFARLERAQGALEMLKRLGEQRPMRVELVNPGVQGNKGRTEHGAALEMAKTAVQEISVKRKGGRPKGSKNKPKPFVAPIPREEPVEKFEKVTLTQEQVATLVSAIRPTKTGSGEYILDISKFFVKPVNGHAAS